MTELTIGQYHLVSNFFSLTIAAMGAATAFLWINRSQVADQYNAVTISGLVTFAGALPPQHIASTRRSRHR